MDVIVSLIVALVALLCYIFGKRFFRFCKYYRRFYKIPGPNVLPFIGIPYTFFKVPKEEQMDLLGKWVDESDNALVNVTILFHGVVVIAKAEHMEVIFRSNEQITKSVLYNVMAPWLGQGLILSTGPRYLHDRKLISQAFHFSVLYKFTDVMIEKAAIFNSCIERKININGDKPFDIFEMGLKCALDIICETAMGVNIHAQEKELYSEYINAVEAITKIVFDRTFQPWYFPDFTFYRSSAGKAVTTAIKTADDFSIGVIKRKQKERKLGITASNESNEEEATGKRKRKAFLDLLLDVNEKDENPLTDEELMDHTNTFMFTGHDTSGALIGWTLFCLGNELDVQKKLHEELDEVLGDSDDQTTLKLLPNLKYLERVIKEVLRLYPSVPLIGRKITEDIQIGGHTILKDTSLMAYIYTLHRDPAVWPDPLRFDPDRFLPENVKNRHPYAYVPFSAGTRSCLGQKYAMLESKLIVAQVMRKFSVKSIDNHSIKKFCAVILRPIDALYVNMMKRSTRNIKTIYEIK